MAGEGIVEFVHSLALPPLVASTAWWQQAAEL